MKLLKKLGTRLNTNGGYLESWGLFWCDGCNQEVEKRLSDGKEAKSCGCLKIKHGEGYGTKLYGVWASIKNRCLNPKAQAYKNYGGRGITICPEWAESYIVFRDWALNNGYVEGLQIDRKENEGNYEPSNCNFVTRTENMRNTRWNKIKNIEQANEIRYLHSTRKYKQKELAIKYNVSCQLISNIIKNEVWKN